MKSTNGTKDTKKSARRSVETPSRRMSKDLRRGKEQRQRIMEAASEIIAKDSAGVMTLQDIAAKIGTSKGMIYYYFKSKGELLYYLYMYAADLVEDAVFPIVNDKSKSPQERLKQVIYTQVNLMCSHWQIWRCFWWDVGLRQTPPDLTRIVRRRMKTHREMLANLVEEINRTEGKSGDDPSTTGRMIGDFMDMLLRWYRTGSHTTPDDMANLAMRYVFNGFFGETQAIPVVAHKEAGIADMPAVDSPVAWLDSTTPRQE